MLLNKTKFLFILTLLAFTFLKAQQPITVLSSDMPAVGNTIVNFKDTIANGITPGNKGSNILWNFSALTAHLRDTVKVLSPANTPHGGTFGSNSNLAFTVNDTNYLFFNNSANTFKGTGAALWIDTIQSVVRSTFSPAFDLYRFPIAFNGNFSGTYSFEQEINVGGNDIRIEFTSNYADTIDAWGIVQTPLGFYEALRQKRVERTRTVVKALPPFWLITVSDTRDTTTDYNWLSKGSKLALVDFNFDTTGALVDISYSSILPKPIARFTFTNNTNTFQFTNTTLNTSGTTYQWNFGDSSPINTTQNPSHTYTANGSFNVCLTATNAQGSHTFCQTINVSGVCPILSANLVKSDASCGNADGSIGANPSGGTAPYSFLWSNNATTQNLNNIMSGNFSVTITDNNGCTVSANNSVNDIGAPIIQISDVTNNLCFGDFTGAIFTSVGGGTPPFVFNWSNGATLSNIENLASGVYTCTVTDANNCSANISVTVIQPSPISIQEIAIQNSIQGSFSGSVEIDISGGTPPYRTDWSNGISGATLIENLPCDTYSVVVTDSNQCQSSDSYTVQCITGVKDAQLEAFQIYPNPVSSQLIIENNTETFYTVQLFDVLGQIKFEQSILGTSKISFAEFPSGIYFLSLKSEHGIEVKRILKP